jgi:hypothetical protein
MPFNQMEQPFTANNIRNQSIRLNWLIGFSVLQFCQSNKNQIITKFLQKGPNNIIST